MTKTVLIVDDSIMMRCLIAETLVDAGWLVVGEASDGREAVDLYQQFRPDAVTMDIVMPDIDGIQALAEIMQYDPYAKVVIVSALGQTGLISEAIRKGAQDFVMKPFSAQQLQETMQVIAEDVEEPIGVWPIRGPTRRTRRFASLT